mgnify:CR=1 FL=1
MSHQPPLSDRQALVIFSGGQDSATCLAWALSRFAAVRTLFRSRGCSAAF